jgi:hypothetical protein
MAETPPKRKAKPKRAEQSVLGTLPASRPDRLGRPRRGTAETGTAKPRARVAKGSAKPRAAAKPSTAAAKPRAGAGKARGHGPAAVRPASPPLRAAHPAEPPPKPIGAPTGTELVTTTIRAAGELAQIGLTVGGQVLKRTIGRIPRP